MKKFLLTAGSNYEPGPGDSDWIACFEKYEEAEKVGRYLKSHGGKDWFQIVDLEYWMKKD